MKRLFTFIVMLGITGFAQHIFAQEVKINSNLAVESDGTLRMDGNSTVWDDIRVAIATRGTGSSNPSFAVMQGNLYAYKFSGTAMNEVFFEVQMPHGWKEGTTIYPHVHWISAGSDNTSTVTWALEYEWQNINGSFGGTTSTISANVLSGGLKTQNINNLKNDGITESDKKISSMLICRLYRAGNTDTNNDDCFLLSFDIHYEVNTVGSHEILTK